MDDTATSPPLAFATLPPLTASRLVAVRANAALGGYVTEAVELAVGQGQALRLRGRSRVLDRRHCHGIHKSRWARPPGSGFQVLELCVTASCILMESAFKLRSVVEGPSVAAPRGGTRASRCSEGEEQADFLLPTMGRDMVFRPELVVTSATGARAVKSAK
jgi:hypothetical protein